MGRIYVMPALLCLSSGRLVRLSGQQDNNGTMC